MKNKIISFIKDTINTYNFKGTVIGISGGIDSAVTGKLLVDALGSNNVLGLLLPERDSAKETLEDSKLVCNFLNIQYKVHDISPIIRAAGVYSFKPPAKLFPRKLQINYAKNAWNIEDNPYISDLKTEGSDEFRKNLAYYRIKHRIRMSLLYLEAEQRQYAVVGTTNKTEVKTGFYVKWGDDSTDIEPILHLYKTQVYALARELNIPDRIINKKPSPDIAPGIMDEYALGIKYEDLDRILLKIEKDEDLKEEDTEKVKKVKDIIYYSSYRNIRNIHL